MSFEISLSDLTALCRGAGFLGSGGGGNPNELLSLVRAAMLKHGPVPIINISELNDDDLIAGIELVGAPLPPEVKNDVKPQIAPVLYHAQNLLGKQLRALMPVEIGGGNALTPFCVAGEASLPIVDGDLLGRAFPEISLISTNVYHIMPSEAYIGNPLTGEVTTLTVSNYEDLERQARAFASLQQSVTAVLIPIILTGQQIKQAAVHNTISRSLQIGSQKTVEALCSVVNGTIQCKGYISRWDYSVKNGFLVGLITVISSDNRTYEIQVRNEYFRLSSGDVCLAEAPELITLLKGMKVVSSDQIKIGDEVVCITCPGPELWYSERGLSLVKHGCLRMI